MKKKFSLFKFILKVTPFIALVISIFAFSNSCQNTKIAEESKTIAENALGLSKESVRPRLAVEPVPSDNGSYILLEEKGGNACTMKVLFKLTNNGQSIAKNINTSDIFVTTDISYEGYNIMCRFISKAEIIPSGTISLTQNQSKYVEVSFTNPFMNEKSLNKLKEEFKNNTFQLPFNIEVNYSGEDNILTKGKVGLSLTLKPKGILDYNYDINE